MTNENKTAECVYNIVSKMLGIDDEKITATFTVDEWAQIYASLKMTIDNLPGTRFAKVCDRIRAKMETFTIDK